MRNQTKEQLNKFFSLIASPQDIGLVIVETKEVRPNESFWREVDKDVLYHVVDGSAGSQGGLPEKFKQAQKGGKRIVLDIKTDPAPTTISFLKEISQFGKFDVKNAEGTTIETIAVVPGSIIVVAERDFIDHEITYPNFYNIFNSAFSLQ